LERLQDRGALVGRSAALLGSRRSVGVLVGMAQTKQLVWSGRSA